MALVTPWYDRDLIGGAERLAWELSHALARAGAQVDVLSTCCRSFLDDWSSNYHRAGTTPYASGVVLHRFRVDARDRVAFGRANTALTNLPRIALRRDRNPLDEAATRAFVAENINSRALQAHLRERGAEYDAVLFVPYLYGTTLGGYEHVAERAFLIPCLHDEGYAYIEPVRAMMAAVRGVLFNSLGEEETAAEIYGPGIFARSRVIGHAVNPVDPPRTPLTIGTFAPHRSRYVLYLGRQDQSKNIDFLIESFRAFRTRRVATSLQLVLAGPRAGSRSEDGIIDLGPVDESAKAALLTYARALAQPSLHESFSRSIYESWYARRPVVVHAECRATARAVEESGGGWSGSTRDEWAALLAEIDEASDDGIDAVGARGWAAALDNGNWDVVARRVLAALDDGLGRAPGPRIDQTVALGERAGMSYAIALGAALRDAGCNASTVIAETGVVRADAKIVAHVSGDALPPLADAYIAHDGEPPLAGVRTAVFAGSQAVAARLDERGIAARVLPMPVSPAGWNGLRPEVTAWADGRSALLSIAPLEAGDAQRLLDVFVAYLSFVERARLLIFDADCDAGARDVLVRECEELDLTAEVVLVGAGREQSYAAYRAADVALAVGQPLGVEAAVMPLWFDVPIVSLGDPVAVETIEAAGIVEDRFEPRRFAALLRLVTSDRRLRAAMTAQGRRVRERHAPWTVAGALLEQLAGSERFAAQRLDADV